MASQTSTASTLAPAYKEKTVVLRGKAEEMQANVEAKLNTRVEEFKEKHKDSSDEELEAFIDSAFDDVKAQVTEQLDNMKSEVKSHAPKKPKFVEGMREEDHKKNMEEYEKNKADYVAYIGYVTNFLSGLVKLFEKIFKSIKEFFRNLWNWIKNALKNIAKKVADFVTFLKDTFAHGIQALLF